MIGQKLRGRSEKRDGQNVSKKGHRRAGDLDGGKKKLKLKVVVWMPKVEDLLFSSEDHLHERMSSRRRHEERLTSLFASRTINSFSFLEFPRDPFVPVSFPTTCRTDHVSQVSVHCDNFMRAR